MPERHVASSAQARVAMKHGTKTHGCAESSLFRALLSYVQRAVLLFFALRLKRKMLVSSVPVVLLHVVRHRLRVLDTVMMIVSVFVIGRRTNISHLVHAAAFIASLVGSIA